MQGRESCILIGMNQPFDQILIVIGVERGKEERSDFNSNEKVPIAGLIKDWIAS